MLRTVKEFGLDPHVKPWTHRPHIVLRGLRAQVQEWNALHELVNLRYYKLCLYWNHPIGPDCEIFREAYCDIRQELPRQRRNGRICLLTGSVCYSYNDDRALLPQEHFLHLAYADNLDLTGLQAPFPEDCLPDYDPNAPKKRKKGRATAEVAQRQVAGAGMCLADVGMLVYTAMLACGGDMWQHPPDDRDFEFDLKKAAHDARVSMVILDPSKPVPPELQEAYGGFEEEEDGQALDEDEEAEEEDEDE